MSSNLAHNHTHSVTEKKLDTLIYTAGGRAGQRVTKEGPSKVPAGSALSLHPSLSADSAARGKSAGPQLCSSMGMHMQKNTAAAPLPLEYQVLLKHSTEKLKYIYIFSAKDV